MAATGDFGRLSLSYLRDNVARAESWLRSVDQACLDS